MYIESAPKLTCTIFQGAQVFDHRISYLSKSWIPVLGILSKKPEVQDLSTQGGCTVGRSAQRTGSLLRGGLFGGHKVDHGLGGGALAF